MTFASKLCRKDSPRAMPTATFILVAQQIGSTPSANPGKKTSTTPAICSTTQQLEQEAFEK